MVAFSVEGSDRGGPCLGTLWLRYLVGGRVSVAGVCTQVDEWPVGGCEGEVGVVIGAVGGAGGVCEELGTLAG